MKLRQFLVYANISLILITIVLTQTPATPTGSTPPPTGNTPPPTGSTPPPTGSTPPPNGPQLTANLPQNLPPIDQSINTQSVTDITDSYFSKLKYMIGWLPPLEQDIIAKCFTSNTDTTRILDPDCYKNNFTNLKSQSAQGIGDQLTNSSKNIRNSLGCLSKVSQTYSDPSDTSATSIQTSMSSIVSLQTTLNNCSAKFAKLMLETLNARRRFFLTTKANIDATSTKDANANYDGFLFTKDDQSPVVTEFKSYCSCLQTFRNSMGTKVVDIQTLIGTLARCKPPSSTQPPQTPPSSSALPPQTPPSSTTQPPQSPTSSSVKPPQIQDNNVPSPQGQMQPQLPINNGQTNQNLLPNMQQPNKANGIINLDQGGMPAANLPQSFQDNINSVTTAANAKNIVEWTTFANKLSLSSNPSSQYKPHPALNDLILSRISDNSFLKDEFKKGNNKSACTDDYLLFCSSGLCICKDSGKYIYI